jgi:hypothetical protein
LLPASMKLGRLADALVVEYVADVAAGAKPGS